MRIIAFVCQAALLAGVAAGADTGEFFESKVRPVLAANCYSCHTDSRMGGLRLDSADGVQKGGKSGPPIVPGKPDDSLLIQAIRQTHPRLKMPPGGKLKDEEIAAIAEWVKSGAVWPAGAAPVSKVTTPEYVITAEQRAFWSFQRVRKPAVPQVKNAARVANPIDNFVFAKLEAQGLQPARPADKRVLIRRATLDLTGLPPTADEVDAFLRDQSPNAFAKVVDRLLDSPRYGERWGRYWLDVARYSDDKLNSTQEEPHPNAFRYRDWVIGAFNKDMPYDVFVKAQIAGDMLESPDPLQYLPGLGYYALSPEMQDERVDATTRGFLGLTVACAQCHNHKFDPIPQKDYYSLQGVFSSSELNKVPLAPKDVVEKWDAEKKAIDKLETRLKDFVAAQADQLGWNSGEPDFAIPLGLTETGAGGRSGRGDAGALEQVPGEPEEGASLLEPVVRRGGEGRYARGVRSGGAGIPGEGGRGQRREAPGGREEQDQARAGPHAQRHEPGRPVLAADREVQFLA